MTSPSYHLFQSDLTVPLMEEKNDKTKHPTNDKADKDEDMGKLGESFLVKICQHTEETLEDSSMEVNASNGSTLVGDANSKQKR